MLFRHFSSTADEVKTAKQIYRTLKKGGKAVVTCWQDSAILEIVFDVQQLVKPSDPLQDLAVLDKWRDPRTMVSSLRAGGFAAVDMSSLPVDSIGRTQEDLVESCAEDFKGMVGDRWTPDEKAEFYPSTLSPINLFEMNSLRLLKRPAR